MKLSNIVKVASVAVAVIGVGAVVYSAIKKEAEPKVVVVVTDEEDQVDDTEVENKSNVLKYSLMAGVICGAISIVPGYFYAAKRSYRKMIDHLIFEALDKGNITLDELVDLAKR